MEKLQKPTEVTQDTAESYEFEHALELHRLHFWEIKQKMNHLRGEILTIVEASLGDDVRLKAVKDLIHNDFNGSEGVLWELAYTYSDLYEKDMQLAEKSLEEKQVEGGETEEIK